MPGNHFEAVLEALSFFPLLGKFIRKAWKHFQSNPNRQPANDVVNGVVNQVVVDDTSANTMVIVNQGSAGDNTGDIVVAPGSGTVVVIKRFILQISREPAAVDVVSQLVSQYPDDSDLGYQVCRYAVRSGLLARWTDAGDVVDAEQNRSFWGELEQLIKDNQERDRPAEPADTDDER